MTTYWTPPMGEGDKLWTQQGGLSFTTCCPWDPSNRISVSVPQVCSLSGCCGD